MPKPTRNTVVDPKGIAPGSSPLIEALLARPVMREVPDRPARPRQDAPPSGLRPTEGDAEPFWSHYVEDRLRHFACEYR